MQTMYIPPCEFLQEECPLDEMKAMTDKPKLIQPRILAALWVASPTAMPKSFVEVWASSKSNTRQRENCCHGDGREAMLNSLSLISQTA